MERIWLKQYPPGVPADIEPTQYSSLVDLLEESFSKFADRKAFICMDKSISYRDLDQMSVALAAYLQGRGLQRGARVALMMPNVLQYPVATAAVLRAGFAVVNVNPLYTPRELEHQLKDSGAEAIIVLENFAHTVEQVIAKTAVKHVIVASMGDLLGFKGVIVNLVVRRVKKMVPAWSLPGAVSFNDALSAGRGATFNKPKLSPGDVAFLQYTGGTTGVSKGATLLHRNIVANVLQNDAWLQPAIVAPPHVDQLMIVCALPLYHIFALTACYLLAVRAGGCNLLIPNPRDIAGFVKELAKYQVNSFPAVNTLYNGLMHPSRFQEARLLQAEDFQRRRHGGAAPRGRAVEGGDRLLHRRRLRPVGDIADADLQSRDHDRVLGIDRHSRALDLDFDPRRRRQRAAARPARRDLRQGPAGDVGLLEQTGRDREGDDRRRLFPHRRHRRDGRDRLHQNRRPQEGHDPGLRLQRLSQRDRGSDREPSGRASNAP
ncbi:acyl-CoA synthetase (AMP-forming)/AMP-acid ligase II [Bradyrhizobium sp. LB9.1b]